ncbi:hypothetical protein ACFLTH_12580 [Bacteroidota bacterium]
MLNKKGQGISINVIIIAAIALLVLVILAVLLLRGGSNLAEGTSCSGVGGQCVPVCGDLNIDGSIYIKHPTAECPLEGDSCCIVLNS